MDLIVTHKNTDFDGLSSLVAASKLYPKSRLLLPGSQEKAVRCFLSLIKDKIKIEEERTCKIDDITRLIIVDNRHRSRIGIAAALLDNKNTKVHIYDHHPHTNTDIKADKDVSKKVGATVTLLLEILDKKGLLNLTPLEATLMLLGIYEETGSLSYSPTTKLDIDMVSKLLALGANLNAVSSYLNRELSESELNILMDLLSSMEVININGLDICFAHAGAEHFDGEMGTVVHKLQEVENYPVIFVLLESATRTKIMARSREPYIDVNKMMANFNGAGHSSAASAKVMGRSLEELKSDILYMIEKTIRPVIFAEDIMTTPVRTISQDERVSEVHDKFKRFGFKGAPVLNDKGEVMGMITSSDLKKALKYDMGHSRVKGYMHLPLISVPPDTPLHELKKILQETDKGRLPVIDNNKLIGIITRTDILKKVHSALFPVQTEGVNIENFRRRMEKKLPDKLMRLIRQIGSEGDRLSVNVFLVGGFVRDLILCRKNFDLDIVVEGSAIDFGHAMKKKIGGTLVEHKKFGTATLVKKWPAWLGPSLHPDNKFKIDIATARRETYEKPAALPTVEFSSLREDLFRRDFTINAMAVNICKDHFGMFIDFFGGIGDLKKGIIRVLHDNSFIDDPTRIFRAVRFEQRFGFSIAKHTEYLIIHAVKQEMFQRTENQRIRDELLLILKENNSEKAVFRMRELHELRFIHPEVTLKRNIKSTFKNIRKCIKWYNKNAIGSRDLDVWLINLMVILDRLTIEQINEVIHKFVFTRSVNLRLVSFKKYASGVRKKLSSKRKLTPSAVYELLEPLSHEVTLYIMATTGSKTALRRIKKFFNEYNGMRLRIKGHDLKKSGIAPGPEYKAILKKILCAKLDGILKTKADELGFMRKVVSAEKGDIKND